MQKELEFSPALLTCEALGAETPVLRAFCYKQLVGVLVVGGGFFSSSSLPIAHHWGPWGLAVAGGAGELKNPQTVAGL